MKLFMNSLSTRVFDTGQRDDFSLVVCRRGSPLLVGIKSREHLTTDYIPVMFTDSKQQTPSPPTKKRNGMLGDGTESRDSLTEFRPPSERSQVEYFFASDAAAIVEHTNRVLYLEDDDVAYATCEGGKVDSSNPQN